MSRATVMAALLGMGLAVPRGAVVFAQGGSSAMGAAESASGGPPIAESRDPGDPRQVMGSPFTVEKVDRADRLMIVRSPDGLRTTIRAAATADGFDTVAAGDRISVDYYPASVVSLGAAKTTVATADSTPTRANAPVLGAAGGLQITSTARVTSVDTQNGTLEVTTARGNPHALAAEAPAARMRLASLHEGDEVTVTYTEAVAVGVHGEK
jgi:hypothetical protein